MATIKTIPSEQCVTFNVKDDQLVHEVARNTNGLPIGPCTVSVYETANPKNFLFRKQNGGLVRDIRTKGKQVWEYFQATNETSISISKSSVIQDEMRRLGVKQVTVKVCSTGKNHLG